MLKCPMTKGWRLALYAGLCRRTDVVAWDRWGKALWPQSLCQRSPRRCGRYWNLGVVEHGENLNCEVGSLECRGGSCRRSLIPFQCGARNAECGTQKRTLGCGQVLSFCTFYACGCFGGGFSLISSYFHLIPLASAVLIIKIIFQNANACSGMIWAAGTWNSAKLA